MKILNKGTLIGMAIGLVAAAGIVYAAQTITSLTQTATTGDKISATWVNAVNNKLGAVGAAGWGSMSCTSYWDKAMGVTCINHVTGRICLGPDLSDSGREYRFAWRCDTPTNWAP